MLPSFRELNFAEAPLPRRTHTGSSVSENNLLGSSVNRKGNPPHPLTALLFEVMVKVGGWARRLGKTLLTFSYTKSSYLFPAGVLYTPAIFFPYSLLSFRESDLAEAQAPRRTLLGDSVNRGAEQCLHSIDPTRYHNV